MAENEANPVLEGDKDDEMDELLNSAIEDFDKVAKAPPKEQSSINASETKGEDVWDAEFLKEVQGDELKVFEEKMKELFSQGLNDDSSSFDNVTIEEHLQKIAVEANKAFLEHSKQDPGFSATISQTLKSLTDEAENLRTELGPEALSAMLNGMGLNDSVRSLSDYLPLMHNMMQSFLSKEVFYPSLKEICEKYPKWLEEHKGEISEKDFQNYSAQYKLMESVCKEFEKETSNDSEETKKERFTKIFSMMEEMQKLGQPPKEFMGEGPPIALEGLPNDIPGLDPAQCVVM